MKKLALTLILSIASICSWADDSGTCGENQTWTYVEATQTLTISGIGEMSNFYEGATPWCYKSYRSSITKVIIESGVTSIGDYAFYGCSGLTEITIPNSVTSIGYAAFASCSGLPSITIPNSVTSIGNSAFSGCSGLTSITIPSSVTSIGGDAFMQCYFFKGSFVNNSELTSNNNWGATLGDKETEDGLLINGTTVIKCRSWATDVVIPNSVTSIGDWSFSGCKGLTSITIPNSVTSIGDNAFERCYFSKDFFVNNSELTSNNNWGATLCDKETEDGLLINGTTVIKCRSWATEVVIPNSVTSIESSAFSECSGLTSIEIPNSVTSIGDWAFGDCIGLTSITIPNSVTSIGRYAFYDCSGLTSIEIPSNVKEIGAGAFDCQNISKVTCFSKRPPVIAENTFADDVYKNATLYIPEGSENTYYATTGWNKFYNIEIIEAQPSIRQDVNGDGVVDTQDVLEIYKYIQEH